MAIDSSAPTEVLILSKRIVRPSVNNHEHKVIHLTPWDLKLISVDYIQKGLLFNKPTTPLSTVIDGLVASFRRTLDIFYPLAGRLVTTKHNEASISISLDCNDQGAEFVQASALDVTVAEISESRFIPTIVRSLFPLNNVLSYDGHFLTLLSVQVTELADGIFLAMSLNHTVADGTSFWHFFNTWSEIARTAMTANNINDTSNIILTNSPPALDRWFSSSCTPPIKLPFASSEEFVKHPERPDYTECAFHFSATAVAQLKSKANKEMNTKNISSLQSVLGHLWRSVTRARNLEPEQVSSYSLAMGCRTRMSPPFPSEYLGNSVYVEAAQAKAGEVVEKGLGWTAWVLNQMIAAQTEEMVVELLEEWPAKPSFTYVKSMKPWDLFTGSSPRFDVYGNDFGWGKPVSVRSGMGNKFNGKATIYSGPEKGSMALEVCLSINALKTLIDDHEFMEFVSQP